MGTVVNRPLRDALRMIVPGPVVLISSMSKGQPNVMTAAWLAAQSLSPTLISVSIHPDRRREFDGFAVFGDRDAQRVRTDGLGVEIRIRNLRGHQRERPR